MKNAYLILVLCAASCVVSAIKMKVCPDNFWRQFNLGEKPSFCSDALGTVVSLTCIWATFLILVGVFKK